MLLAAVTRQGANPHSADDGDTHNHARPHTKGKKVQASPVHACD